MDKLYIPGDLVMTNGVSGGTAKDVVYRVTSSDPSRIFVLDDGTVLKGIVRLEQKMKVIFIMEVVIFILKTLFRFPLLQRFQRRMDGILQGTIRILMELC